jgi:hypothetical protein
MGTALYVYWQDADHWLGYFEEYPDYITQGESLKVDRSTCKTCIAIWQGARSPACAVSPN